MLPASSGIVFALATKKAFVQLSHVSKLFEKMIPRYTKTPVSRSLVRFRVLS